MNVLGDLPLLDDILRHWRKVLGDDFTAYRHHCFRVAKFCLALSSSHEHAEEKIAIATAFHDLGIWAHGTFDYLSGSERLARDYLAAQGLSEWSSEIAAMIGNHHKLTPYGGNHACLVEPFRRADWVDVSLGRLRFGLSRQLIAETRAVFPNAGFHGRLVALAARRFRQHPFSPLPMLRL